MLKKTIAIILAAMLIMLAGCGDNSESGSSSVSSGDNTPAAVNTELQLLYCANDTMNPFKTISKLNAELAYLLFEPLVKVDDSFEQVLILAENISTEGTVCTVTLRNAFFSDGSEVAADDVLYSYGLAKESDRFSYLFYEIDTVEATDARTVVFTLKEHDPYFSRLLTFPILKTGSDQLRNEDNVELVPIGCGRFVFDEAGTALVPNDSFFGSKAAITKINLINAPDNESMQHYVEVGAADIYYAEMQDDSIIRMSGQKKTVNLNNLIYIGINHNYAPLKSAELRYAISSAISREAIVKSAFYTNAVAASGFFHPDLKEVAGYQTIQSSADTKISVENLAKIGYNNLNAQGYYENSQGNVLELTLLVNNTGSAKMAAAELIAEQLKAAGIKITVNAVDSTAYFEALSSGAFQLYLGEVKLLPNMDIRSLVLSGGKAAYGMTDADTATNTDIADTENEGSDTGDGSPGFDAETSYISVINGFYEGKNTVVDVASSLLASMPIVPVVYRSSIVFYSNDIEDIGAASNCDIFLSIDKYKIK